MTNAFRKMEDTMRFKIEEGVVNCRAIKVTCSDANGNVCKNELPIFTDKLSKDSFIQLPEEILGINAETFQVVCRGRWQ